MNCPWLHTAAIFCGGKSLRMGQPKEKMMLPTGITMIEHVYRVVQPLCRDVVLVGGSAHIPETMKKLHRVPDCFEDIGPMGGLQALLSSGLDEEYLVLPCDLDQLNAEIIQLLIRAKGDLPIVLEFQGRVQPMIGRYSTRLLPAIDDKIQQGLYALKGLLHDIDHTRITVPSQLAVALHNVNTPHDFNEQ